MDKYTVVSTAVGENNQVELPSGARPINAMYHPNTGVLTIVALIEVTNQPNIFTRRIEEVGSKESDADTIEFGESGKDEPGKDEPISREFGTKESSTKESGTKESSTKESGTKESGTKEPIHRQFPSEESANKERVYNKPTDKQESEDEN